MKHIDIAIAEIGKKEIPLGSNWGPHVQKYLKSVGITFPAAWCMAFVHWCVSEAYGKTAMPKTGGVLKCWNTIPAQYKVKYPKPGDIFIMNFGKGLGHTGFIERLEAVANGQMIVHTIEGNATTISGSREGIEVCRKNTRKLSDFVGFIRL